jgi:hypothetical protein
MNLFALEKFWQSILVQVIARDAIVPDHGKGQHEDLSTVRRVGQRLGIAVSE